MSKRLRQVSSIHPVSSPPPEGSGAPPNPEVLRVVSRNVQRLRAQNGYTRNDVARLSGLSLDEIEQVELGQGAPTIKTLWGLATALRVPFSTLLARDDERPSKPSLQHASEAVKLTTHADGTVCRSLLPKARGPRRTELHELKLPPGTSRVALLRPAGSIDNLLVTSGCAVIDAQGVRHVLRTGDSVELRSDLPRHYSNVGDTDATLYVVITYPKQVG